MESVMNLRGASVRYLFCMGLAMALACTQSRLAGSISETTNGGVAGVIVDQGGAGAGQTRVVLLPADYDPVKNTDVVSADTTDSLGKYAFSNVPQGHYAILAVSVDKKTNALVPEIDIGDNPDTVAADTLRPPGAVKVMLPAGADGVNGYLYVPGTLCFAWLKTTSGFVTLDFVPVDKAATIAYSTTNSLSSTVLRYGVRVTSGDTTVVWNSGWNYSREITLNTTATGANVTGNVTNFPALIRLTAGNFDFSQARNNGEDIRFAKLDNTFLSYEIERWDAFAGIAEVWVKVDTVFGNDSNQSITMYWGNPSAASESSGAAVFDTAAGFAGVYHLGENGDSVFDATGDAFNGENAGSAPAAGMIGNARNFANGNFIKISGLLKSPSNVTLSAWVRSDTSNRGQDGHLGQDIVSIGDHVGIRLDDSFVGTCGYYNKSIVNDTSFAITSSGVYLANTGWHFIAYSINTTTHVDVLYIDGVQIAVFNDANPILYAGLGTDSYIGIHGDNLKVYNFTGGIDEVRVNKVPLNPDWIKLCFMNQKEQDALVKFR